MHEAAAQVNACDTWFFLRPHLLGVIPAVCCGFWSTCLITATGRRCRCMCLAASEATDGARFPVKGRSRTGSEIDRQFSNPCRPVAPFIQATRTTTRRGITTALSRRIQPSPPVPSPRPLIVHSPPGRPWSPLGHSESAGMPRATEGQGGRGGVQRSPGQTDKYGSSSAREGRLEVPFRHWRYGGGGPCREASPPDESP